MDYNYSIIHQSPGIPLTETGAQPMVYHLEDDRPLPNDNHQAEDLQMNPKTNNDSLVTEPLLLRLTDCDTLDEIRVISLRNKELTSCLRMLSQCLNLNIAYLQGNRIHLQDMMYFQSFISLKKIDLSNNQIASLPSSTVFQKLINLKFLYLHNNKISKWHDISSLSALPGILHITLFSNPVYLVPGYRHFLVNSVPTLLALDHYVITDEERIDDASFGYRFRALNEFMKLHVPDYAREKSAEQHLFNLEVDVYRLKRIFERNSPSILIQAVYRGWRQRNLVRLQMHQKIIKVVKIQKVIRGFLTRLRFKRELMDMLQLTGQQYLMMTNQQIRQKSAGIVIKKFMLKKYREKKREQREIKSAITIQRHVRGRQTRQKSYWQLLNLEDYPYIYILKEQRPLFVKFLKDLAPTFEQKFGLNLEKLVEKIHDTNKYDTIRVAEPDIFDYKWQPIIQFVMPTSLSRLRDNKHRERHCFQNPHFTMFNMYFKPNFLLNRQSWNTLKVRNCKVYKHKVLNQIAQKAKRLQPKNQFVFQDQYRDFFIFQPDNKELLSLVLRYILHYNMQANKLGEQFFLVFYEKVLQKVAAASLIQRNWRSHIFRRRFAPPQKYPINELIEKRAAQCLQRWWSNIRFRRRIEGLEKIKKFCDRIQSPQVYIEQSIYNNLKKITKMIQTQLRYEEQTLDFDFNQVNNQACLTVSEVHKFVTRYHSQAIPYWFGIPFRNLEFSQTPNYNDLQALFHLNDVDTIVLPINYVINHQQRKLDIDRDLIFLQITCNSIEEARRRAYIIATLTYDIHKRIFANLATAEMLEDPFQMQRIVKMRQRFEIDPEPPFIQQTSNLEEKLVKDFFIDQLRQPHSGLFICNRDTKIARYAQFSKLTFKSMKLESNTEVTLSFADQYESKLFDREHERVLNGGKRAGLTNFQTKQIQKEAFNLLKNRRTQAMKESIQEFKTLKDHQKILFSMAQDQEVVEKREEVNKLREITKIIQTEQKFELDKNLQVFLALNREEKHLRKELVEKQHEVEYKEKFLKKMQVTQQHKNQQEKKQEQASFIVSFMQAKNLIEKQMKIGRKIKDNKLVKQEKKEMVNKIKEVEATNREKVQVRSTLFDHQIKESMSSVVQRASKSLVQYNNRRNNRESYLSAQDRVDDTWDTSGRKLILTTTAGEDNSILKTRSFGLKPQSQVHQSRNLPQSFNKSYILPPLNDQSLIGRNDGSNNQQYQTTNKTFVSYQTTTQGPQIQSNDQRSNRGLEEIYSYIHDDSVRRISQNWKRDSTRPIFAEENFPLTRNINQQQYNTNKQHQPAYHLTLDMHNGLTGKNSNLNVDLNNSNSTFSINRTNTEMNNIDLNNARSSERRSLLARISTSQLQQ